MTSKLQLYFPVIRSRREVLDEILTDEKLRETFMSWSKIHQEEFLDFCTGMRGIKILYDGFFKSVFDPDLVPERLNTLLSVLLHRKVSIISVLPRESPQLVDESALVIMDMVVMLDDKKVVNMEVQRIGYAFPGERAACYSADLLLRQYKKAKDHKGKKFHYNDIKSVYTIVLFEESTAEFHQYPDQYRHCFQQVSDTGLNINLLQEYIFIPLDIFKEIAHNKGISNEEEAWLAFLCMDDPEIIIQLIEKYPEFKEMYKEVYGICRNMEDVMGLFSEELYIMDKNAEQYMIDQMQEKIDKQAEVIEENEKVIEENEKVIAERERLIERERMEKEQALQKVQELQEALRRLQD